MYYIPDLILSILIIFYFIPVNHTLHKIKCKIFSDKGFILIAIPLVLIGEVCKLIIKMTEYAKPCPMCDVITWRVRDYYLFIPNYTNSEYDGSDKVEKYCEKCGFTCLYDVRKLLGYRPKEIKYSD